MILIMYTYCSHYYVKKLPIFVILLQRIIMRVTVLILPCLFLGPQGPDFRGPPQDQFGDPRDRRMPFDPRDPRNREPPRGITSYIFCCNN